MVDEEGAELESSRVTRILRDDIMLGRRVPGSRLIERDIAAELHVSRLPVREAIRVLVGEGIVIARPRSWAVVRDVTERDIRDFAEVRESIEVISFVFAAQRHDAEGLARLRQCLDEEIEAAARGDIIASRAAAGRFHAIIGELADNEMLAELMAVFITRLRWLFGQYEDAAGMADEHEVIFAAISARDVPALQELVPRHLERGKAAAEWRLQQLRESSV